MSDKLQIVEIETIRQNDYIRQGPMGLGWHRASFDGDLAVSFTFRFNDGSSVVVQSSVESENDDGSFGRLKVGDIVDRSMFGGPSTSVAATTEADCSDIPF